MAIIQQWKIQSRTGHCAETGRAFADGEPFYTRIDADPEGDGYIRRDLSVDAWESAPHEPPPFSYWRSTFRFPPAVPEDEASSLQKNDAESLLERMMEEDDPAMDKARYILVVMLERKRVLKQVGEEQVEDRRLLIYEHAKTGEGYVVTDPQVRLEEVEALQDEVLELLMRFSGETAPETGTGAPNSLASDAGAPQDSE